MKHRNINKVVIAGGGTGGHLIPAFAIADALKKQKKDIDIMFIGSCRGLEAKLYKNRSEKYYLINVRGISRSLKLKSFTEPTVKRFFRARASRPRAADRRARTGAGVGRRSRAASARARARGAARRGPPRTRRSRARPSRRRRASRARPARRPSRSE